MDTQTDFQGQFGNNVTVSGPAEYERLCREAGVQAENPRERAYAWQYAEYSRAEWARMSREARVHQVLGAAYAYWLNHQPRPRRLVKTVIADCGHECPAGSVMTSSRGTCCPDCYVGRD